MIPPTMNITPRPTMVEAEIHTITIGTMANLWEEVEEGGGGKEERGEEKIERDKARC